MARLTPQYLSRALHRVKDFVSRHPKGVHEDDLLKVDTYAALSKRERIQLLSIIEDNSTLELTQVGKKGQERYWLRHKLHVDVANAEPPVPLLTRNVFSPVVDKTPHKFCMSCGHSKPLVEFEVNPGDKRHLDTCKSCLSALMTQAQQPKPESKPEPEQIMTKQKSPAELRKAAEEMLRQAEEAEQMSGFKDAFTKRFAPLRQELLQANQKLDRAVEAVIEAQDEVSKAMNKLRDFRIDG